MSSEGSDFASIFTGLICWLTAYYLGERCLPDVISYYNPRFYEKLRTSRKEVVFFTVLMGIVLTTLSSPFCAYAALDEFSNQRGMTSDSPGLWRQNYVREQWDLGPQARVCVAARGVLWISSLHSTDMYSLFAIHYVGSILALISWLNFRWPNLIFLTLFTTLVSEIPGHLVFLVAAYRETLEDVSPKVERFETRLAQVNAVQYALVRGCGIIAVAWMLWLDEPGVQDRPMAEQLYAYSLLAVYSAFFASFLLRKDPTRRSAYPITPLPLGRKSQST